MLRYGGAFSVGRRGAQARRALRADPIRFDEPWSRLVAQVGLPAALRSLECKVVQNVEDLAAAGDDSGRPTAIGRPLRSPHHGDAAVAKRRGHRRALMIRRARCGRSPNEQIDLLHLRRPGGDRHRERAAVRGRAAAHRRALRVAGAADGDCRKCCSVISSSPGDMSRCSMPCSKTRRGSARQRFGNAVSARRRCASARRAYGADPWIWKRWPDCAVVFNRPLVDRMSRRNIRDLQTADDVPEGPAMACPLRRRATTLGVPMVKEVELIGSIVIYRAGSAAVHGQADRAGRELRRTGRDRHREYAAAQRAAAHRRSDQVAGAADGDLGGAESHLASPGELEPVFESMLENATRICEAKFGTLVLCDGGGFARSRCMARRRICRYRAAARSDVRPRARQRALVRAVSTKQVHPHRRSRSRGAYTERDPRFACRRRARTVFRRADAQGRAS